MSAFAIGDRVQVTDPALAQMRAIMRRAGHEPAPNHTGTVEEVWDDGQVLIEFDDGIGAPYEGPRGHPARRRPDPVSRKSDRLTIACWAAALILAGFALGVLLVR